MKNRSYDRERDDYVSEGRHLVEADNMAGEAAVSVPFRPRLLPAPTSFWTPERVQNDIDFEKELTAYLEKQGWKKQI